MKEVQCEEPVQACIPHRHQASSEREKERERERDSRKSRKNSKRKENTSSARGQFRPVLHTCTRPAKIGITKREKEKREEGEYLQCEELVQACTPHMHQASRERGRE